MIDEQKIDRDIAKLKGKAIFECWKCKCSFNADPGQVICKNCGHIWLTWKNYWELFK